MIDLMRHTELDMEAVAELSPMLYIGQLWYGATTRDRMRQLEGFGVDVRPFDQTPYMRAGSRAARSIRHRLHVGGVIARFNRDVVAYARAFGRPYVAWVDKGVWIWPETIDRLRESGCKFLVHFTNDAAFLCNRSRFFEGSVPKYDVLVTTKRFEIEHYKATGARSVIETRPGYEGSFHYPRSPVAEYASDVTFIGRREPHYIRRLRAIAKLDIHLLISGPGWSRRYFDRNLYGAFWAKRYVVEGGIWGDDYPKALCSAKICIGLLSKLFPETETIRTYEIPACGAFLLAERTPDHQGLFEEGREAEFFGSDEELRDKVRFYLAHNEARRRIAAAGRERCVKSGYSLTTRFHDLLGRIYKEMAK